ncbi:UPF0488 protein C8orf33 homolog [Scomber japonicus]|uniref:UPF0488 protein C8orf33 homolog n=1 Tax=Scomber japonicus TaxID=13676 RepID=UPI0023066334|nr:UPF0488 protein C8orf33 homolog [Scomber japonicus]
MAEQRLMFIDIKTNSTSSVEGRAENPLWSLSDNTFRFNFLSGDSPALEEQSSSSARLEAVESPISFTGEDSAFAFNFQIPPVVPEEDMMTTEASDVAHCVHEDDTSVLEDVSSPPEASKTKKKKKKSGKKKGSDNTEAKQEPSSAERSQGGEDAELSAEEQLKRELDWCIEQLELGMTSQKGTPKQKEEASRALKTLRSSKAPLVKKRQVMRAMTGDYRKKMEEEKSKQFKLIQSELASAQVKVLPESPKKSVFHRRAKVNTETGASEEKLQQTEAQDTEQKAQEETPAFVFTASNEEFRFNFV